jgi:hypothetical protein
VVKCLRFPRNPPRHFDILMSLPTWAAKELIDMDETLNFQGLCNKIKVIVLLQIPPLMQKD